MKVNVFINRVNSECEGYHAHTHVEKRAKLLCIGFDYFIRLVKCHDQPCNPKADFEDEETIALLKVEFIKSRKWEILKNIFIAD